MIILASDTSTSLGSVAVRDLNGRVMFVEMNDSKPHSETLLPAVVEVLSLAGLDRGDVQALAVGTGPGAFTGLRVGLATFKGWASASCLPLLPVPSLDAVAFPVLREGKTVMVVADARKGEVYAAYFKRLDDYGLPVRQRKTELIPLGDVQAWMDSTGDNGALILGTGVPLLKEREIGDRLRLADHPGHPSAMEVLAAGEIMLSLDRTVEPSSLVPEYVRPPSAKPTGGSGGLSDQ
jgi:tRNA threonylcarbamoyladenosine biosynthesis protein TsaB